jgi:hypothetical protein
VTLIDAPSFARSGLSERGSEATPYTTASRDPPGAAATVDAGLIWLLDEVAPVAELVPIGAEPGDGAA